MEAKKRAELRVKIAKIIESYAGGNSCGCYITDGNDPPDELALEYADEVLDLLGVEHEQD